MVVDRHQLLDDRGFREVNIDSGDAKHQPGPSLTALIGALDEDGISPHEAEDVP